MSPFTQGLLTGIVATVVFQYGMYALARYLVRGWQGANERDESMKRHLDELYQDIDRGKMP